MAAALNPAGLLDLLHAEETVVLPSLRAAGALRATFDRQQLARGLRAWAPPPVLTWDEWTATLWRALLLEGSDDRVLLNRLQEEALWAEIITAGPREALLSPTALAELSRLARSGFALAADAHALDRISRTAESYDARAFATWCQTFGDRCRADRLLPAALLEHALARHAAKLTPYLPKKLHFVGFDRFSPAKTRLLQQLEENRISIFAAPLRASAQNITRHAAVVGGGPADELRWAVRFLRQSYEGARNAHPRFALIVPDEAAERNRLEPLLREVLAPELEPISADLSSAPWQFGREAPLADLPIIEQALCLLRWLQGPLRTEQIGALLLSPFFAHSEPYEDRARFEVQGLRRSLFLRPELTLRQVLSLTRKPHGQTAAPSLLLPEWRALDELLGDLRPSGTGSYADWIEAIRKVLRTVGWPGPRTLSPTEFRATEAWEALLDGLATLDLGHRRVGFATVLEHLAREAKRVSCPSSTEEAPVLILCLSETEGCCFDRAILLRATDNQLPVAEHPHPLLGYGLQRDLGLPGTDAAQTYADARSRLASLAARCDDLLLTTAAADEHGSLRLTPLASDLGFLSQDSQNLLPPAVPPAPLAEDIIPDALPLPPLPSPQIAGGASVLELQAACGFRAFASLRLGATVPEDHGLGLDARATGSLLHRAMELFWTEVKTQAALRALDEAEQRSTAARAVKEAISPWRAGIGPSDTWAAAYLDLVQQRLVRLIMLWLHHELERGNFLVLPPEQKQTVPIGPLELSIRPDRIDKVDGGYVFIDYKTSANVHTSHWLGERPEAPQLPLYALLAEPDEVRGLAFARVRPGKDMAWLGMEDEVGIFPPKRNRPLRNLNDDLDAWRIELERLAVDFAEGNTDIDPKTFPGTCQYCAHRLLCRLDAETLLASEQDGEDPELSLDGSGHREEVERG